MQALNGGGTLTDTFNVLTEDGTTQTRHDHHPRAERCRGDHRRTTGEVTEAGVADGTRRSGDLDATDVDNTADAWQAVAAGAASASGYGTYELTAAGVWTYTLDNTNAAVQALNGGDTLTDTFTRADRGRHRAGRDRSPSTAQNDAAMITGDATGDVTEAGRVERHADRDRRSARPTSTTRPTPGRRWRRARRASAATAPIRWRRTGVWTYTLDNANAAVQALNGAATLTDTFNVR